MAVYGCDRKKEGKIMRKRDTRNNLTATSPPSVDAPLMSGFV